MAAVEREKIVQPGPLGEGLLVNRQHLPFEMDRGIAHRATIGVIVLATDQTIEHEYRKIFQIDGVALYESRIPTRPRSTRRRWRRWKPA